MMEKNTFDLELLRLSDIFIKKGYIMTDAEVLDEVLADEAGEYEDKLMNREELDDDDF